MSLDFLLRAKPRGARSVALVVLEEVGEACPALEHVVDRLGDGCVARELGTFTANPLVQFIEERGRAGLV